LVGFSGLSRFGRGWIAVPEDQRIVLPFSGEDQGWTLADPLPVHGVPDGWDLESLAVTDAGDLILGTEQMRDRNQDVIFRARREGAIFRVVQRWTFDYTHFHIQAVSNQGIEGVCAVGTLWVAASEMVVESGDGARFAPARVYDPSHVHGHPLLLALTSATGKVSDLTCRRHPQGLEMFAIERHFGVSRVLRYLLRNDDARSTLEAVVVRDLSGEFGSNALPNFEGLAFFDDQQLLLISDNFYGSRQGLTRMLRVPIEPH
jgi:hypothetical protein